jgi:hypothetical protein
MTKAKGMKTTEPQVHKLVIPHFPTRGTQHGHLVEALVNVFQRAHVNDRVHVGAIHSRNCPVANSGNDSPWKTTLLGGVEQSSCAVVHLTISVES